MGRRRLEVGEHGQVKVTTIGPKKYRARCEVRCRDGKIRSVQADGPSKGAATDAVRARAKQRADEAGRATPGNTVATLTPTTPVSTLADKWLEQKEQSGDVTEQTLEDYRTYSRIIREGIGELRIGEVTTGTLEWLIETEAADRPSKAANLRRQLREMFAIAIRHDAYRSANPAREVTVAKAKRTTVRALTVDELNAYREHIRLWQESPARKDGARGGRPRARGLLDFVNIQLATGARINEVLALRWSDVDLEAARPTARIGATLVSVKGEGIVRQEHRKAKDSYTVTLPRFAVDTLLRMKVSAVPNAHDVIFPSSRGTLMNAANLRTQLRSAHKDSEWVWVKPHTFRKTVATLVAQESSLEDAAAQLGHAGTAVTARHYVQRSESAPDLTSVLDRLAPDSNRPQEYPRN